MNPAPQRTSSRPPVGRVASWRARIERFLTRDVWAQDISHLPTFRRWLYKVARVAYLTVRGATEDRCTSRAAALTYVTVLSIVPLLALAFSVAKGLDAYKDLRDSVITPFLEELEPSHDASGEAIGVVIPETAPGTESETDAAVGDTTGSVADTDASDPTNTPVDFLGDIEINYRRPTADVVTDWTPLSGVDHYAMVDEIPPDDDTTYNSTITPGNVDTCTVESAPLVGCNVIAAQVIYERRRPDAGNTSTEPVFRVGGANYVKHPVGDPTSYVYNYGVWTLNPSTLGTLTDAAFNASSVGYKKVT